MELGGSKSAIPECRQCTEKAKVQFWYVNADLSRDQYAVCLEHMEAGVNVTNAHGASTMRVF